MVGNFLLSVLSMVLVRCWLHFASLLSGGLRPIVTDLVSKENFGAIHFAALNERVAEDLGA